MTTKWMLLLVGGVSGIAVNAVLARSADLKTMIVTNLTGDLRIQQNVPCTEDVDETHPVTQGRLELSPAQASTCPAASSSC